MLIPKYEYAACYLTKQTKVSRNKYIEVLELVPFVLMSDSHF